MADDIATLGLAVDSSGLDAAKAKLGEFVDTAKRAEGATAGMGKSSADAASQQGRFSQEMQKAQGATAAFAVVNEGLTRQMAAMAGGLGLVGTALAAYSNTGLLAAVGIKAVSDALGGLSQSAHNIADKADQLKKFAAATGLTTDQIQLLSKEAHQFGLNGEEIQGGLQRFVAGMEAVRQGGGPALDAIRRINGGLAEQMQAAENTGEQLRFFQQALREAGTQSEQSALLRAFTGRGSLGQIEFWKNADLSKMNGDIASIGHGLDANLIDKVRKFKIEIEEVDKKIQHAAGANWAPLILALELMAKQAQLAAIKGVNAIIPSQANATASYVGVENEQRIAAALKEQERLNAAIETAKKIYGDDDNPWADRLNLELENATRKLQELQAVAQKTIEIDVKLNLPKLDLKEVQNAVFGAVSLKAPTVNAVGGETSGVVRGVAETSAQVEAYKKLQEVLGSLISVADQVAQKQRELIVAQQNGIKITKEQTTELLAQARLAAEQSQISAGQGQRQVDEVNKLKAAYPGLTLAQAQSSRELDNQLKLAQAVTGAEKMMVQEAINFQKHLTEGETPARAIAIAQKETAIAQAQLNASADEQLHGMKDQFAVASAVTGVEKARASAQATTNALIRSGVDATKAMAVGEQQFANAMAQAESAAKGQLLTLQDQAAAAGAVTGAEKIAAQGQATYNALVREGVSSTTAQAVAEQQMANAVAQVNAQVSNQIISLTEQTELIRAGTGAMADELKAQQAVNQAIRNGATDMNALADLFDAVLENAQAQSAKAKGPLVSDAPGSQILTQQEEWNKAHGLDTTRVYDPTQPWGVGLQTKQTQSSLNNIVDQLFGQGGTLQDAIRKIQGIPTSKTGLNQFDPELKNSTLIDLLGRLADQDKTAAIPAIQQELDLLRQQPHTLANDDAIKTLQDRLKELTTAVDGNTDALSDLYKTDPRLSHIGFRASSTTPLDLSKLPAVTGTAPSIVPASAPTVDAGLGSSGPLRYGFSFADGGIMSAYGPVAMRRYDRGGVASSPQLAMFGEGDGPEAFVPLKDGAIPVRLANDNGVGRGDVTVTIGDIVINGSVDAATLDKLKLSQFQQAQDIKRSIGAR